MFVSTSDYGTDSFIARTPVQTAYVRETQEIPEQQMHPPFMSALASLYGSQDAQLARKVRQQKELSEALQRQIEEKRRNLAIQKRDPAYPLAEPQPRTMPIKKPIQWQHMAPRTKPNRKQLSISMPINRSHQISSTLNFNAVPTPPLGFSLRRSLPEREVMNFTRPKEHTIKQPQHSYSSMQTKNTSQLPRLQSSSELLYPDGHISRIGTPLSFN